MTNNFELTPEIRYAIYKKEIAEYDKTISSNGLTLILRNLFQSNPFQRPSKLRSIAEDGIENLRERVRENFVDENLPLLMAQAKLEAEADGITIKL